jgi:dynein heavy chain
VVRLWRNEALRVFHDRMICPEDKAVVRDAIAGAVARRWGAAAEPVLADPLLFGDYRGLAKQLLAEDDAADAGAAPAPSAPCRASAAGEAIAAAARRASSSGDRAAAAAAARPYEDVGGYADVKPLFERLLAAYNERAAKKMQLVFFDDALEHLTRICRTVALPQGNCLLVGVGGSGKSSLARLAAYAIGAQVGGPRHAA